MLLRHWPAVCTGSLLAKPKNSRSLSMAAQEQILSMNNEHISILQNDAIVLLKQLIATPSFSKEEDNTADLIEEFLERKGVKTRVHLNNIWATNKFYDENKPTILLNSHHDTVKPNKGDRKSTRLNSSHIPLSRM